MNVRTIIGVASLAAATLLLESTLIRFLAVAQYYHFAFLVVSLALLGFGASGSILALFPRLHSVKKFPYGTEVSLIGGILPFSGLAFSISVAFAYYVVNFIPFDSYSIAWESRQVVFFVIYYLVLTLPFLFSGLGIGATIASSAGRSHIVYAANLIGSGIGALFALGALWLAGVPGAMVTSALVGLFVFYTGAFEKLPKIGQTILISIILVVIGVFIHMTAINLNNRSPVGIKVSPYKGLEQALRYPGSEVIFSRWNAISRIDIVADAGTRLLPGLSYTYKGLPPSQHGLSIDADSIQPITRILPAQFDAAAYMAESVAFDLRPKGLVLVLEPGGGLGVLQALAGDSKEITAVISNPLIPHGVETSTPDINIYSQPGVHVAYETVRVFLQRDQGSYDVVYFPLTEAYRPVTSGAYSLSETYDLTVEAMEGMLARVKSDGIFVMTRWLQVPPSESIRSIAMIMTALERGFLSQPGEALIAFRGIQTMTIMVKPGGWHEDELIEIREFAERNRFDLVWAPDILLEETNRFNLLPESFYYQVVRDLLETEDRSTFYKDYPFEISPPTDDQPFFFHFFKWGQTKELLAMLGMTWQPFGGSGFFVLLALLALVILLSILLILGPVLYLQFKSSKIGKLNPDLNMQPARKWQILVYFGLLGLGFLLVEIPIIQRSILLLGHPIYAFSIVILSILSFSGLGSSLARASWLPKKWVFLALVILALVTPFLFYLLKIGALGWPFGLRIFLVIVTLAPLSILMGIPFPIGLAWLEKMNVKSGYISLIPWAWAINGCASVISAVLAAIFAISFGFTFVLLIGAAAYGVAGILFARMWVN
jgi:hypothetical protein